MKDPYEVLGVPRGADPETIKKAYRDLVQKYHPDKYAGNPLEDLAQEKMKEINEAYDAIMKGNGTGSYGSGSYGTGAYGGSGTFAEVRQLIRNGRYQEAEDKLNTVGNRTAEWYYLKGTIAMGRGWMDEAQQNFRIAMSMDPGNTEYRNAFNSVSGAGGYSYRQQRSTPTNSNCGCCELCQLLICLDCLCDCI